MPPGSGIMADRLVGGNVAIAHGLAISKTVAPVVQHVPCRWSESDIMRMALHIVSHRDNGWLAIDDPVPSGATILGKGLGGESIAAQLADRDGRTPWMARPGYVERGSDSYRAYYARIGAGEWDLSYTVRLNNDQGRDEEPDRLDSARTGAIRASQDRALAVMQACGGTQSFNAVNTSAPAGPPDAHVHDPESAVDADGLQGVRRGQAPASLGLLRPRGRHNGEAVQVHPAAAWPDQLPDQPL
jgi:hypothetical protein